MSERLALDISASYEAREIGKRGDDSHFCGGNKITRTEFSQDVSAILIRSVKILGSEVGVPGLGRGNASIVDTSLPNIKVHYWLDAGTKLTYHLKIWVED